MSFLECSPRKISIIFRQKLLIELRAIVTLIQIKNLLKFFVSDKPKPGNHLHHEHTVFV